MDLSKSVWNIGGLGKLKHVFQNLFEFSLLLIALLILFTFISRAEMCIII